MDRMDLLTAAAFQALLTKEGKITDGPRIDSIARQAREIAVRAEGAIVDMEGSPLLEQSGDSDE